MGVDHRRHRVGGVVEAIDELEAERDKERDAEKKERQQRQPLRHRSVDVTHQAVAGKAHANQQQDQEQQHGRAARLAIERRTGGGDGVGGNAAHGVLVFLWADMERMTEIFPIDDTP
jgi:hypothetical protein